MGEGEEEGEELDCPQDALVGVEQLQRRFFVIAEAEREEHIQAALGQRDAELDDLDEAMDVRRWRLSVLIGWSGLGDRVFVQADQLMRSVA